MTCPHKSVLCLNEYELIRKYRCSTCSGVMMCACDRENGERFLAHQLQEGCVLETQERMPVTLGFVDDICRKCRGLPVEAHPRAAIHGQTSKIKRYYWRELQLGVFKRFADHVEATVLDPGVFWADEAKALRGEVEREVFEEIKQLHATNPKYDFKETSQAEILAQQDVEEIRLNATFAPRTQGHRAGIMDGTEIVAAEEFAARHFQRAGWSVLFSESRPFHVLFGVYLWLLIQDDADSRCGMCGFGAKMAYPSLSLTKDELLWILKPDDLGSTGYAERRSEAIDEHFKSMLPPDRGELLLLFDYWIEGSTLLRDYLCAHDPSDVEKARAIVEVLTPEAAQQIFCNFRPVVGQDPPFSYLGRSKGEARTETQETLMLIAGLRKGDSLRCCGSS